MCVIRSLGGLFYLQLSRKYNSHIYFTLKSFKVRGNKYGSSNKKGYTV